jgi:hypothetical protein
MPDESLLRDKARDAVQKGKMPPRKPGRMWGGPGVGVSCAVCELPVTKDQLEIEFEFAHDGNGPELDRFRVHVRCFAAWEFELKEASQ